MHVIRHALHGHTTTYAGQRSLRLIPKPQLFLAEPWKISAKYVHGSNADFLKTEVGILDIIECREYYENQVIPRPMKA